MDELKNWTIAQLQERHLSYQMTDDVITITKGNRAGIISFYETFVDESIMVYDQCVFHLHFEYVEQTEILIKAMLDQMDVELKSATKGVLLCCSSGLTTGYFKHRMNQYLALRHSIYRCEAMSVDEWVMYQDPYELLLIAPQMHHALSRLQMRYPEHTFAEIAPDTFATYNCAALYEQINQYFQLEDDL